METGREAFQRVVERFGPRAAFPRTQTANCMSEEEVVAFLNAEDGRRVLLFRFTDGTEVELSDPSVQVTEDGKRECIATVVREVPRVDAAAGSELCFGLGEVADVRLGRAAQKLDQYAARKVGHSEGGLFYADRA